MHFVLLPFAYNKKAREANSWNTEYKQILSYRPWLTVGLTSSSFILRIPDFILFFIILNFYNLITTHNFSFPMSVKCFPSFRITELLMILKMWHFPLVLLNTLIITRKYNYSLSKKLISPSQLPLMLENVIKDAKSVLSIIKVCVHMPIRNVKAGKVR